jgi:outer membrane biosynthesis protein TonB
MSAVYILLWTGSLSLSVALVVLLRTRWGHSRPLHKCALLSLLVHLLLAWAAMTVHFISGAGGGSGPPIRVRIMREGAAELAFVDIPDAPAADTAPPLLEPPPEESQASPTEETTTAVEEPPQGPPAEPIESSASPASELAMPDDAAAARPDEVVNEPPAVVPRRNVDEERASEATAAPAVEMASPAVTQPGVAAATPYSLRTAPGRLGLVEREGGSAQTEAAVMSALRWLAEAQSREGRWDADQFGAGQEQAVLGHNRGGAGRGADTGISALALLAYLGAGHTHLGGEYEHTVRRGLDFLLRSQAADGSLFGDATLYAQMYCHAMATFALAETQAMTADRRLEPAVSRAVLYCTAAQNTTSGGWRYRPGDSGDTSQLGWQMMALASAQRAGISVPEQAWIRVERFLRSVRRGEFGGLASYRPDSGPSTSMTAEALYCRLLLGEFLAGGSDEQAAGEATRQLLSAPPDARQVNLYYWYYATLALHHRHQRDERAAADWRAWNDGLTAALLATQVTEGPDAGSWNTNTLWGGYGGRVYTTAMAAMCLEVYYRYAPPAAAPSRWTAARPAAQGSR